MKRRDYAIIVFTTLLVLGAIGCRQWYQARNLNSHAIAVLEQNRHIIKKIDLNMVEAPSELVLNGKYHETIRVEKGRIRFLHADCPDKICVNTGWLYKPGDIAVCIPNRAVLTIEN